MVSVADTTRELDYITQLEQYILMPWWQRLFARNPITIKKESKPLLTNKDFDVLSPKKLTLVEQHQNKK